LHQNLQTFFKLVIIIFYLNVYYNDQNLRCQSSLRCLSMYATAHSWHIADCSSRPRTSALKVYNTIQYYFIRKLSRRNLNIVVIVTVSPITSPGYRFLNAKKLANLVPNLTLTLTITLPLQLFDSLGTDSIWI